MDAIEAGEDVTVDFDRGKIVTKKGEFAFPPYPDFVRGLIEDGGLIPHVKKSLGLK
ncbi:MAG: 2,3-dimethylmalate dehydratase small subunit [Synergistetes bacterium ADurb.Bin520]|nr:MAG: 2,3-dimethylmalate dehydratase small subunit [Synergistetes bacterium ADurb.Bin520]